ncbi:hypothetical protein HZH66_005790 [Vespula vulgaris]|uniref:HTH OST-type domain-containing protein n=1 Tax=Vespula vulgaris TaxID=7454 RepID=A0A834KB23_VESVU|nr:uncharacterized protein LOC127064280 isoform X2 [Vespula vulgaris]KAF7400606.1 hypothetical protein HZH66_005790 [Vespula vulgaris]
MQDASGRYEDVQKIILSLLVSRKDAIPLGVLAKDYQDQEGEPIPWKEFGYITLLDYLKSMPKFISFERLNGTYYVRGVASDKSKHVSSLVARQKISLKKRNYIRRTYRPSYYYPKTSTPRIHIPANILSDIINMVKQNPNGIKKEHVLKEVNDKLPCINISITDLEEQIKNLSHELFIDGNRIYPLKKYTKPISNKCLSSKILSRGEKVNLPSKDSVELPKYFVSGETDSNKESDIDDEDRFTFASKLQNNSENKNKISNKKQPISMFIQESVSKFNNQVDQLNDKSRFDNKGIKHNSSEKNVTLHTPIEKLQDDVTYLGSEDVKILISDRTRFRLEKLIQKYPNGIWCAELPEKYIEEYNVPLNYIELGFNSVREFASYLPEIFQCKQLHPSADFILYDAKIKLPDTKKNNKTKLLNVAELYTQSYLEEDEVEALPVVVSSDTSNKLMPEGVMIIGECVGQINVTDLENITQPYIEVFVEEVFTPSLFWIQLRKKKKLFNKLMDDLHIFYKEKYMDYKIPPVVLEKGLNCACKYNDIWHRGIIKTVKPDLQVTVMFYDYGTLKTYSPDAIYYLHRLFSYLPAQAIPCGLYNTKPCSGEQWSKGVTYEFAERTSQRPLIATIVSTDPENNSMLVTLTDTMEEEDVHINDWMVHQNLAVHGQMVRIRPRNFPFYYYLQCQEHSKTNSEDLSRSTSDITKSSKTLVHAIDLLKNLYKDLYCSLSASSSNNSRNNFVSNDSKNCTQRSKKLSNNFIQDSHSEVPKGLNNFSEMLKNNKQFHSDSKVISNSDYNGKSDKKQLPLETSKYVSNITQSTIRDENSSKKNQCKKELEEINSLNCLFLATQPEEQENYNIKMNVTNFIKRNERDIEKCIQQKEQKHKDIPLPKKCFTNAVNLSLDLQSNYQDYDTLPDDNIITTNNNFKLINKYKSNINLQNIEIGVSEIILSKLRSNRSSVNDKSSISTLHNINDSLNEVKQLTINKSNISNIENSMLLNVHDSSSMIEINEERDSICKTNNTLMQICNKRNEDAKLDSEDYSKNYDSNNETKVEALDNTLEISKNEEISNLIYHKDVNENNLIKITSQSQSFLEIEQHYSEYMELHKSTENAIKKVILTCNDNNLQCDKNECNIDSNTGNSGNSIHPNTKIDQIIKNDDELRITEINGNGSEKSLNVMKDINCNNDNCKDYLESQISEMKMIEDAEGILLSNIDCLKSSNNINEVKKNNDQALDSLIQSNIAEQKHVLNKYKKEEHLDNVSDNVTHATDNKISSNFEKSEELMFEKTDEKTIPIFHDINCQYDSDDEWTIEGNIFDFFGNSILSSLKMNQLIKSDDDLIKITEINGDGSDKSM